MTLDDTALKAWIGRSETLHDQIHPTPVAALSGVTDDARGGKLFGSAGTGRTCRGAAGSPV